MSEWLEHSTGKQKVAGSNPTRGSGWKTPSVHPAVKWVPDLIQGRKGDAILAAGRAREQCANVVPPDGLF